MKVRQLIEILSTLDGDTFVHVKSQGHPYVRGGECNHLLALQAVELNGKVGQVALVVHCKNDKVVSDGIKTAQEIGLIAEAFTSYASEQGTPSIGQIDVILAGKRLDANRLIPKPNYGDDADAAKALAAHFFKTGQFSGQK